jgi:Tol biopolymer transport system component
LESGSGNAQLPRWSPDGARILYLRRGTGLFQRPSGGGGTEERVTDLSLDPNSWSADGGPIVYTVFDPKSNRDVGALALDGGKAMPIAHTTFNEVHGQLSSDGKWLAYVSDESGQNELYVQSFPVPAVRTRVSTAGGDQPRWRRDGQELFYIAPDGGLMRV